MKFKDVKKNVKKFGYFIFLLYLCSRKRIYNKNTMI